MSWRSPAAETTVHENVYPARYAGASFKRKTTWIPVFHRAKLAFTLVNEDEDVTAKQAKRIADKIYDRLGAHASSADAERWAWMLLDRERAKASPKRDRSGPRARSSGKRRGKRR